MARERDCVSSLRGSLGWTELTQSFTAQSVCRVVNFQLFLRALIALLLLAFLPFSLICREKYLNTLLQVEAMLKLWFPHIPMQPVLTSTSNATFTPGSLQDTSSSIPPHKHRDQLHIPVKVSFSAILRHFHAFSLSPIVASFTDEPCFAFLEASTQLDRHRLPHTVPCSLQVPPSQFGGKESPGRRL